MNKSALQDRLSSCLHPTREQIIRILLTLLVMFIPLIMALILTVLRGQNLFFALPDWSDEHWWFAQYAGMSEYGHPLGYFGYTGHHAKFGTWATWGMFPTLITGTLSQIFGWGLHSFVYYNFFYLAASSLIFILLTKPSIRNLCMLAVANGLMYITICYSVICMNEIVRYSMAIVLSGIMYCLIMVPEVSRFRMILRWTLVPLLLMYATCFYVILGAFIPIYLMIMLRKWKPIWRLAATTPISVIAIKLLKSLNSLTSSPYIPDPYAITFSPPTLKLKILDFFYSLLGNAHNVDPFYLLTQADASNTSAFMLWFCVLLYVLMGFLFWRLIKNAKKPENRDLFSVYLMCLFLLLCFWGGHIVLYNTTDWTFMRGCNTAVCCVIFLCAMMPKGESQPWQASTIVCIVGFFSFIAVFVSVFTTSSRFSTPEQDAQWAQEKAMLEEVLILDTDAEDPWSNTAVMSGITTEMYCRLPYGVGINSAVPDVINENARYVIIGDNYSNEAERQADIDVLLENNHTIIREFDFCTVLENQAHSFK